MEKIAEEEIQSWRERWKRNPCIVDEILTLLLGEKQPQSGEEYLSRLTAIRGRLEEENRRFPDAHASKSFQLEGESLAIGIFFIQGFNYIKIPFVDLRGLAGENVQAKRLFAVGCRLEGADLSFAHLERADLRWAHLEKADLWNAHLEEADLRWAHLVEADGVSNLTGARLAWSHLEGADLVGADLVGADLVGAHLEGVDLLQADLRSANLYEVHLEGANLYEAHLEEADLWESHIEGADLRRAFLEGACFGGAHIGRLWNLPDNCALSEDFHLSLLAEQLTTTFGSNSFQFHSRTALRRHWINKGNPSFFNRFMPLLVLPDQWFVTDFTGADIHEANFAAARDLERYIRDQQFLTNLKGKHKHIYTFWRLTSNCGDSITRIAIFSALILVFFAFLFGTLPWPNLAPTLIPQFLTMNEPPINPHLYGFANGVESEALPDWAKWFFVSFDIFTNLGIRSTHPQNVVGVFLVFLETIAGFVNLGLMLSVFSNKYARRAG